MKVRKAVIPAAGLGTRFLPATKAQPKEMLPVVDKPAIQYVVEEAVRAGIQDILIISGRGKRSIEDHFDRSFELEYYLEEKGKYDLLKEVRQVSELGVIHYIRQRDPLGLGNAIAVARSRRRHYDRLTRRHHHLVAADDDGKLIEIAISTLIDRFITFDINVAIVFHTGSGRNQPPHDHVFLQPAQVVHATRNRGFGKHARGLLERRRRDERIGRERRFRDTQ